MKIIFDYNSLINKFHILCKVISDSEIVRDIGMI